MKQRNSSVAVEKRPGADWTIGYLDAATGEIEYMSVFGARDVDEAVEEARRSLSAGSLIGIEEADNRYEIVSVVRDGLPRRAE